MSEQISVATLADHLLLPEEYLTALGLVDAANGVGIDYGSEARWRVRTGLNGPEGVQKFSWGKKGKPIVPYGANLDGKLDQAREKGFVILVEGESDCWALWYADFPALGLPGVDMVGKLQREHLDGVERVLVAQETDEGGARFVQNVADRIGELFAKDPPQLAVMTMDDAAKVKDPAELWVASGADASKFASQLDERIEVAKRVPILKPADRRFTIVHGSDIEKLPDPEWLIADVLMKGSLALLYGEPGIRKSFLALDMTGCVATGRHWAGHPTNRGRVLYVMAEGPGDIGLRVRAWRVANEVEAVDDADFLLGPVNLQANSTGADVPALLNQLVDTGDAYDFVIFDTLARSMAGADENSARDMGLVVEACDVIRHHLGATVLLVHHTTKDARRERGSGSLIGAVDTAMKLDKNGVFRCEKQKMAAEFPSMKFKLVEEEPSAVLVSVGGGETNLETYDRTGLSLSLVSEIGLTASDWQAAAQEKGIPRSSFYRLKKDLIEDGLVGEIGEGKGALYRTTKKGLKRGKVSNWGVRP